MLSWGYCGDISIARVLEFRKNQEARSKVVICLGSKTTANTNAGIKKTSFSLRLKIRRTNQHHRKEGEAA